MKPLLLILPLALIATVPHAAQTRARVGIVDVQQVVAALPGSAAYLSLTKRVDADLRGKQAKLQQLISRANTSRRPADIQAAQKAQRDFLSTQQSHQQRLNTEFRPLAGRINTTVANVAKGSGFTVVLDRRVAAQSSLVVYANTATTDLTPAVLRAIKK
ncbi:OmpH family outer membrane protein [Deinococcus planocerae]|uniref:OmpH family outer membrane protein n=1 Tax=Deinococcus planocerae TaxID=1737569 RepID=UPI000C7E8D2D|nr:OmpH family outer membrane protein [Deinococcus planocerae]